MFGRISKLTVSLGLLIIISASFMSQVSDFCTFRIGKDNVRTIFNCLAVLLVAIFSVCFLRNRPNFRTIIATFLVLVAGLVVIWQIKIPVEKIHILEYGMLSWLATRDFIKINNRLKAIISVSLFSFIVGCLDEGFQALLPYRYFDMRDILFNTLGGVWGMVLYLLGRRSRQYGR